MRILKRYPATSFFVLAFLISWSIRISMVILGIDVAPLKLLAEFGLTFAALIVTGAISGKAGVRALLSRVKRYRVNPVWYVLVLSGPAALQLVSIGLFVLFGGPGARFQFSGLLLPIILTIGLLLSFGEEIGWRGFAFPQMQARFHPVVASLIIGVLWAIWHIPGDFPTMLKNPALLSESSTYLAFLWFLGLTTTGSVLMGWIYNRTGGSILLMALFHLGLSLLGQFATTPQAIGQFNPMDLSTIMMAVIAIIVIAVTATKPATDQEKTREQSPILDLANVQESTK